MTHFHEEVESRGWPGLGREVRQICQEVGLPDINIQNILKKDVKKAIQMSHIEDMLGQYENSRKLRDIENDNFSTLQDYFTDNNLANSRMKFKSQTEMLKKFPENYKKKIQKRRKCHEMQPVPRRNDPKSLAYLS